MTSDVEVTSARDASGDLEEWRLTLPGDQPHAQTPASPITTARIVAAVKRCWSKTLFERSARFSHSRDGTTGGTTGRLLYT
jgi:hypothetical protein